MADIQDAAARLDARRLLSKAREAGRRTLDEHSAKTLLTSFGIAAPPGEVVADAAAARLAAVRLNPPLAAKLVGQEAIHKSDVGGVRLSLGTEDDVHAAILGLAEAAARHEVVVTGYLVEEMAPPGCEMVIGGLRDPRFGMVVMVGLGGVFVEIFADTAFRVCPIDEFDAKDMIDQLQAAPLLRGIRGRRVVSEDALVRALLAVGGEQGLLMTLHDEIEELDINPLIVAEHDALACDARIVLRARDGERR
jgi:acetyl-CoA synthetase (ADP-forming)